MVRSTRGSSSAAKHAPMLRDRPCPCSIPSLRRSLVLLSSQYQPSCLSPHLDAIALPYPDVNDVLRLLLMGVRAILGPRLVGLYLYGSLSSGDFDPGSSDVDFLVVTDGPLPQERLARLEGMHARIAASGLPYARKLEGSYFPRAALRRHDPSNTRHPTIGVDWDFGLGEHDSGLDIQRHIVRTAGVTVWGPPPDTLIDPVPPDRLREVARQQLCGFWARQLDGPEPEWLRTREYQAFAILTMCRILYTLETGEIASKPVAAAWARQGLGAPWYALIERALAWRHDTSPDDMAEMLSFVRYVVDREG